MARKNDSDRPVPPIAPDAEAAILGALLVNPDGIYTVRNELRPDDFSQVTYREVYDAMLALAHDGTPCDLVTVADELERRGKLATVGGPSYLTGLTICPPSTMYPECYARIVRQCRIKRDLIEASGEMVREAYNGSDSGQLISLSRARMADIEKLLMRQDNGIGLRESVDYYLDILQHRNEERGKPKLEFPWSDLAALMPYLGPGTLVAVAGEPGTGKTSFMECCAEIWAKNGWKVTYFHYEISDEEMLDRRMQRHTGISIRRLRPADRLEAEDYQAVLAASERILQWPGQLRYFHCPGWSVSTMVASARQVQERDGLDVVVFDYLNKVPYDDRGMRLNSAQARGQDVEEFKTFLEQTGTVGLMGAQFDKESGYKQFRTLADVLGTSEVEHKVNVGIVIDRRRGVDGCRMTDTTARVVKCNVGREGSISLVFDGQYLRFVSAVKQKLDVLMDKSWQDKE